MQNEIISAEIYLHPVNVASATAEIDAELTEIEKMLKTYTSTASMLDYSVAVISGILAGAIDAFWVKDTIVFGEGQVPIGDQIKDIISRLTAVNAEKKPIPKPVSFKPAEEGFPCKMPIPDSLIKSPTPLGLALSILMQAGLGGMLLQKANRKIQFLPDEISPGNGVILAVAAGIVGTLKWLSVISERAPESSETVHFKTLDKICVLIHDTPAFGRIVKAIEEWQKKLPNELKAFKMKNNGTNMTIDQVFCSFFMMISNIPVLKNTDLRKVTEKFAEAKRLGLDEVPVLKALNRQAFPVLINEIIVRTMFFATRLARELAKTEDISQIDWENVLPVGNRTIDRLIALSSMTLSVADVADAAIHAAIDSGGEVVLFAKGFVTRFNYVAAGRAAVAVVREVSNERTEAELIRLKRQLTEAKTAKVLEILQRYQQQLEGRICEYVAEDIGSFLTGINTIDRGLLGNDSDLVIRGNVMIQKVLGREAQFSDQKGFDALMDSDTPLRF